MNNTVNKFQFFIDIFASSENQILHLLEERILQKSCTVYEVNVLTL